MTASMTIREYRAERVDQVLDAQYNAFVQGVRAACGKMDPDGLNDLADLAPDVARERLARFEGPSGFAIFHEINHGALLSAFTGRRARSTLYLFGNALIAIKMTKHVPEVGLYVPLRMFVEELDEASVRATYDRPSATLAQFGSAPVNEVALDLDHKVEQLLATAARYRS